MSELDTLFDRVRSGDARAFAAWMGRVERPVRQSLRSFARAVDVEAVVQETLLRMWLLARDGERRLEGENASLRFAIGIARNVARNEARRLRRIELVEPVELETAPAPASPSPDPGLLKAIRDCLAELAGRPREALLARIERGAEDDLVLAGRVGMTLNTFLQNVVRARRQVEECLKGKRVRLEEVLS